MERTRSSGPTRWRSGIGRACAELFAEEGAEVVIADIEEEAGRAAARDVGGLYLSVDVTDPSSVEAMIKTLDRAAQPSSNKDLASSSETPPWRQPS